MNCLTILGILSTILAILIIVRPFWVSRKPKAISAIEERKRCAKCGCDTGNRFWPADVKYVRFPKDYNGECLQTTCAFCGYVWGEKCKDAP